MRALATLRVVVMLQVLRAEPLLEGEVSEQVDVSLGQLAPAPGLLHLLLQTAWRCQDQLLQGLHIWAHARTRLSVAWLNEITTHLKKVDP